MNNTIRTGFATATAAAAVIAMTSCGSEVAPPAQDIGGTSSENERTTPDARNRSGNRMDFGDDYGSAERGAEKAAPAGSGTRNRMEFGDDW